MQTNHSLMPKLTILRLDANHALLSVLITTLLHFKLWALWHSLWKYELDIMQITIWRCFQPGAWAYLANYNRLPSQRANNDLQPLFIPMTIWFKI